MRKADSVRIALSFGFTSVFVARVVSYRGYNVCYLCDCRFSRPNPQSFCSDKTPAQQLQMEMSKKNSIQNVLNIYFSVQTFKSEFNGAGVFCDAIVVFLSPGKWLFATLQTSDFNLWIFIETFSNSHVKQMIYNRDANVAYVWVSVRGSLFFYFSISMCLVMPNILQCCRPQI